MPLLVVRLRDLEGIAWREGRAAARVVERRILRSFEVTASRTLRANDVLAHDPDTQDFIAALVSPTRGDRTVATPADCRATLARLAAAIRSGGGMQVETGWTVVDGLVASDRLPAVVDAALERGARERERYAFFSTIGHELRTPLTSIRGYLETLLEDDLDPVTARRFLEVARNEALRLGRLVDGMFDISMLDLRAGSAGPEKTPLQASITAALEAVAPIAAARGARVTQLRTGTGDVATSADRLTQILVNVMENAVKHGREGGVVFVSVAASSAAADARTEGADGEEPPPEPLRPDRLVEALLSLLLLHPELAPGISRRLNPAWIDGQEGGEVVRHILDAHAHDDWQDATHFLNACDDRTRDYLAGLLVGGEPAPEEAPPDTLATNLLDQLEARARQHHLQQLEQSVKSGLLAPDAVMAALNEIQAIRRAAASTPG